MGENQFKAKSRKLKSDKKRLGFFREIERGLKLENYFENGLPVQYVPKVLFVLVLAIAYIGNTHYADKVTRQINKAQVDVEDLRADFTTMKAEVMLATKQSEVAKRVKAIDLEESLQPPYKIIDKE